MKVWKHSCDITRILIGYVLSDARFDWLVGNMSMRQENLFQSKSKKPSIFLDCVSGLHNCLEFSQLPLVFR